MAVKKENKIWNNMNVVEEIDTETGVITIKSRPTSSNPDGTKLASSGADGSWTLNNETEFRNLLNNARRSRGKKPLTESEFNIQFNKSAIPEFNKDRADVLNNRSNYASQEEFERSIKSFVDAGTPNIIDTKSGEATNSNGQQISVDEAKERALLESIVRSFNPIYLSEKPLSSGAANLRYPLDQIPDLGYDFVTFTAYEYIAGDLITSTGDERLGNSVVKISLPILPSIEETNGVDWGKDKMNIIQAKAAEIATRSIGGADVGDALSNLLSGTAQGIQDIFGQSGIKESIIAHFAGQAVGANVLGRQSGSVLNPNLELLFSGPQLRTFNFNFRFRPRFKEENEEIRRIIKAFKRNMHPQRSQGEVFLRTPNVFKIKYYHDGVPHPYLNEIKTCALINFKVNYTPDNNYMTYQDGGLTGYDVTMSFSELVPIYADEITGDGAYGIDNNHGGMSF